MFHLFPSESMKKLCFVLLLVFPAVVSGDSGCEEGTSADRSRAETQKYKVGAIAAILAAGAIGVCLPFLGRSIPALRPENNIFFLIKAFAAGVILSTGFIHILPDAFESLTSPCLNPNPWENFPFTGFIAMMAAIGTLMIESFATGFYRPVHWENPHMNADQESGAGHDNSGHVHVHTHGSHGHAHGSVDGGRSELMRHRVISQVLELGILVHSVIIGVSLGASDGVETIKPLIGALSFHQFFEGMGLGSCIAQAKFKSLSVAIMATFFSLTTPIGIVVGIGISSVYNEKSPTALIVQGVFDGLARDSIYIALVDLPAADFMSPKLQSNKRIHLGANVCLLLGAGCMAVLAKWA